MWDKFTDFIYLLNHTVAGEGGGLDLQRCIKIIRKQKEVVRLGIKTLKILQELVRKR